MNNPNRFDPNNVVDPSDIAYSPFQQYEPLRSTTFNRIFNKYRGSLRNFNCILGIALADGDFKWKVGKWYDADDLVWIENPNYVQDENKPISDDLLDRYLCFRCNFEHTSVEDNNPINYITYVSDVDTWTKISTITVGCLTNWYNEALHDLLKIRWDNIYGVPEYLSKEYIQSIVDRFGNYWTKDEINTMPQIQVEDSRRLGTKLPSVEYDNDTVAVRGSDGSLKVTKLFTDPKVENATTLNKLDSVAIVKKSGEVVKGSVDLVRAFLQTPAHTHSPKYSGVFRGDGTKVSGSSGITVSDRSVSRMLEFKVPYSGSESYTMELGIQKLGDEPFTRQAYLLSQDKDFAYFRVCGTWSDSAEFVVKVFDIGGYGIVTDYLSINDGTDTTLPTVDKGPAESEESQGSQANRSLLRYRFTY
ncbi:TPA: hypothetical protein SFZ51_001700 [Campylobacter jejuni]|uniref:Uncharacterized protein n=1 Tax=Campylobacter jejuni TaxID=197 RepID=A0A431EE89_CAMJU|nr:hypothetical protein [Campylobacter jejuni]RTJ79560.1 hypothetical protein C3H57_04115 [Campylobacter jejuni]HEG8092069.1 hypothetical protein [Campylobacter jejuni]HEG8097789.1 hypothetical protein [Campylobacter jejuni]HEG8104594.1 hypothetical protein [Campylobacter jejuni]HEG8134890.1 hypothetical protein [Campylobacter jejuni]